MNTLSNKKGDCIQDNLDKAKKKYLKKENERNKWYIHKPGSVQENGTHKVICGFEIQTDHSILIWKSGLGLINKK